jgi:Leucine Rich repeat
VLSFSSLKNISPDLFARYNHLKVLKLWDCTYFVANHIMQAIFEHLVCLEELVCEGATKITSIGFLGRNQVSNCRITRLTNLRRADFADKLRLNCFMLATITNHTLQHLDISKCAQITTDGVRMLRSKLPSLEVLNLKNNPQIDYDNVLN